jgi:antitoxin YefM
MTSVNLTEFRKNIKKYLDMVIDDYELLVINRRKDKAVVVMSLDEYNSWQATIHELSSKANRDRLDEAIQQYKDGKMQERELLEE